MEKNESKQKNPLRGDNTELEKFKRRLIRAVARMLLHEKRNEAEVWEGLRKQTGCDCKELWDRMHALTIRKLQRLLNAHDRVDLLPKPARMSATDWLMFDTVIVHEDFDTIGMTETAKEDKQVIIDLFDLVEKYKIEFLAGDQLADAWSEATMHYNGDYRQCSPMLLQRRWYQFKLATRARFYKFWSMYKGTVKRLYLAENYTPTPLQTKLALRYKPLVVKPFMSWEELIKFKLVILPEEFELKSNAKGSKNEEIAPEVMCIEPNLETIDLDDDSDIEYRNLPQKDNQPVVTIKQEPIDEIDIDENVPYENRQEKISHFAEAVMEATAMELDEIELADSADSLNGISGNAKELEKANEDVVTKIPSIEAKITLTEEKDTESLVAEEQIVDLPVTTGSLDEFNALPANESDNDIHIIREEDNAVSAIKNEMHKEVVLPQITSIFGGVDVSNESLSKIGLLTAQITNNASNAIIENGKRATNTDSIDISSDSLDGLPVDNDGTIPIVTENQIPPKGSFDIIKGEADVKSKNSWFGELSNDIEFADDGIQLTDDGIDVDEDGALQIDEIKLEIKDEEDGNDMAVEINEDDTTPNVDEKLLMLPVVRMVKLDDMGILPIRLLQHVDNKGIIDIINMKSKPIVKKIEEKTESSDDDMEVEIKKVKLSSALLKKPRNRTYNPIQVCKNPDFNTRLKKLNVGFFSSARNRLLLKACQPLSVDVSKAFECRLIDGTMYLEASDGNDIHKNIDLTESSQNVSVVPSAMPVQSLIDNTNSETPPPILVEANPTRERSPAVMSPDILAVNRNQRLLTAEIAPLNSKNKFTHVPVTIINTQPRYGKYTAGPASRIKLTHTPVVDITKEDNVSKTSQNTAPNVKNKEMYKNQVPWKPRQKPEIPWFCNKSYIYSSDTLLALDSLNKMLCLLTEGEKEEPQKKKKKKYKSTIKELDDSIISIDDISASSTKDDDVQVVSETKLDEAPGKKRKKKGKTLDPNAPKRLKPVFCCWARERICQLLFSKKLISKHNCPFPMCVCCCRKALVDYLLKKKESGKKSDSEKNIVEPLGCVGIGELTGVAAKSVIDDDVAEIVPIDQETPLESTSDSLVTNTKSTNTNEEATNPANENSNDVVICNTETTQTEEPIVLDHDIDNNIEVGAETTVITAETLVSAPTADAQQTDRKLNTKPAKPRIRVMSSVGPMKLLEANQSRQAISNKFNMEEKKVIVVNPINPKVAKENVITLRRSLMPPPPPPSLKYNKGMPTSQKTFPISPKPIAIAPKLHPKSKNNLKQRMIYLNSKLISELPTDNPIFLGNNKILLTTAKFPANFKAFEAFQSNLKQTMALPIGIQLILLPSGRLTYIRDRKFPISEEFIAALPQLIEAIQKQIDATVVAHPNTNTLPEIINLSDDEIEVVESAEKIEGEISKEINQTKTPDNSDNAKADFEPAITIDTSISQNIVETPVSEMSKDSINETTTAVPCADNGNTQSDKNIAINDNVIITANNETNGDARSDNGNKEPGKNIPFSESETNITANNETNETTGDARSDNDNKEPDENMPISESETNITANNETHETTGDARSDNDNKEPDENIPISESETNITANNETTGDALSDNDNKEPGESIPISESETNTTGSNDKENTGMKSKNILSDLMAMSGIEPTDISSTQEQAPELIPQEQSLIAQQELVQMPMDNSETIPVLTVQNLRGQPTHAEHPIKIAPTPTHENIVVATIPRKTLTSSLTAITSLSELKYACAQYSSFFKLDIDTGVLHPINVCMKKFNDNTSEKRPKIKTYLPKTPKPSEPIDLTDDDVIEAVKSTETDDHNSISIANATDGGEASTFTIEPANNESLLRINNRFTESHDININGINITSCGEVKPLKLFKSKVGRPSILGKKLKEIQKRISEAMTTQDIIRRKLKRKQEFNEFAYDEDVQVMTVDSNDDSSDEEPLAIIASKMRAAEKVDADNEKMEESKDNSSENASESIEIEAPPLDMPAETDEQINEESLQEDMLTEDEEDIPMEYLEETLLEEDEADEDCILGV